ncbi:MAG TPA: hypothetical protein VF784_13825 [Anaerolineales bacterium]
MSTRVTIFMPTLDKGTVVYRPVAAETSAGFVFRILPPEDGIPEGEKWRFAPGTFVKCERQILGGNAALVAREQVEF